MRIKELLALLPDSHRDNLEYLIKFLSEVARHQERNKMPPHNLGLVIGPNIFAHTSAEDDAMKSSIGIGVTLVETMIEYADDIFPGGKR